MGNVTSTHQRGKVATTARRRLLAALSLALVAGSLVGCGGSDPGLVERIDRLEAEIRAKDKRIDDLERRAEVKKAETKRASMPNMDDVEAKLARGAMQLRRDAETKFGAGSVTDFRTSEVETADPDKPFNATITFVIVGSDGNARSVTSRAIGDRSGNWKLPSVDDIAEQAAAAPPTQQTAQSPAAPERTPAPTPTNVMGAGQTVEIDWGDTPQTRSSQPRPSAPAPPTQPVKPAPAAIPNAVMPADRDVVIDFGD